MPTFLSQSKIPAESMIERLPRMDHNDWTPIIARCTRRGRCVKLREDNCSAWLAHQQFVVPSPEQIVDAAAQFRCHLHPILVALEMHGLTFG